MKLSVIERSRTRGERMLLLAYAAGALAGCGQAAISDADQAFDTAFTAAMARKQPIDLTRLETGAWFKVCAVGEDHPSSMFTGARARPGEAAFDTLVDPAFLSPGQLGAGALAFQYADGVEVRPLSGLAINMGSAINICVRRDAAVLIDSPDSGWRFRDGATAR
jgi:hypothetical protein